MIFITLIYIAMGHFLGNWPTYCLELWTGKIYMHYILETLCLKLSYTNLPIQFIVFEIHLALIQTRISHSANISDGLVCLMNYNAEKKMFNDWWYNFTMIPSERLVGPSPPLPSPPLPSPPLPSPPLPSPPLPSPPLPSPPLPSPPLPSPPLPSPPLPSPPLPSPPLPSPPLPSPPLHSPPLPSPPLPSHVCYCRGTIVCALKSHVCIALANVRYSLAYIH